MSFSVALAGSHGVNDVGPIEALATRSIQHSWQLWSSLVFALHADADLHFQAHRDNPEQIPISTEIVLGSVGVALTAIPDLVHG
jgi:hypothetical protein